MQNFNLYLLINNLFILDDYIDFLVYNDEAYLFNNDKEIFYFDLVDVYLNYIFYELYKLKCEV